LKHEEDKEILLIIWKDEAPRWQMILLEVFVIIERNTRDKGESCFYCVENTNAGERRNGRRNQRDPSLNRQP
jgi:hypothetical protein